MGIFSEYLDRRLDFPTISALRKEQLKRISAARDGRNVFVYAADLQKRNAPIAIGYEDLLPIQDQIEGLSGNSIDVILETGGGSAEITEDIVKTLRDKFDHVAFIVPGCAKSAGTIMVMAGDEILLEPASSLGPIDAQMPGVTGKPFSAHAFLAGIEKIKDEVTTTGVLNRAYIPILQGVSPGDIQDAQNGLDFGKKLVTDWLAEYKFKYWNTHSSTGQPVTTEEKKKRAAEIADILCDHGLWLRHGRSIKIRDLEEMKLKITDYTKSPDLFDAIRRYYVLMRMSFETNIFKMFETIDAQVYRYASQPIPSPQPGQTPQMAGMDFQCPTCKNIVKLQANLGKPRPLLAGFMPYPKNDVLICPHCGTNSNLAPMRLQLEAQTGKKVAFS